MSIEKLKTKCPLCSITYELGCLLNHFEVYHRVEKTEAVDIVRRFYLALEKEGI